MNSEREGMKKEPVTAQFKEEPQNEAGRTDKGRKGKSSVGVSD
jgi:hypothetical protein